MNHGRRHGRWPWRVTRIHDWASWVPFALVIGALLTLVLVPLIGHWYVRPLHFDMRSVAEPGRGQVTRMHVALALQGSALHDFLETRAEGARRRFWEAAAQERSASAQLWLLTQRLGPDVHRRYADVRRLEERWHETADPIASGTGTDPGAALAAAEDLFEELLIAAARLDEAIDAAAQERRQRITAAERAQRQLMPVVGLVALLAVAIVALIGRRLRTVAAAAERGRAELERANESRARLMRGLSHDLKNPLNAIDGHALLLAEGIKGELSPGQQGSVARIRIAVRSLLSLVDDLLELSRAETGELRLAVRPVEVPQLVHEVAEEHRAAAEATGHRLDVAIAPGVQVVHTDPDRVRQVLGNLLSNAIKYTPPGGQVVLRARSQPHHGAARHDGKWLAMDVIDTGPGIPPDRIEEIFREFARLDTGRHQPGAGLGLAIARRIARLLGGDVTVVNGEERGAIFTLTLPANQIGNA